MYYSSWSLPLIANLRHHLLLDLSVRQLKVCEHNVLIKVIQLKQLEAVTNL